MKPRKVVAAGMLATIVIGLLGAVVITTGWVGLLTLTVIAGGCFCVALAIHVCIYFLASP